MKNMKKTAGNREVRPDYDRKVFEILHMIRTKNMTDKEVCDACPIGTITPKTLSMWRKGPTNGGTRYPAGFRIDAVALVCGYVTAWVPSNKKPNDMTNVVPIRFSAEIPPKKIRSRKK